MSRGTTLLSNWLRAIDVCDEQRCTQARAEPQRMRDLRDLNLHRREGKPANKTGSRTVQRHMSTQGEHRISPGSSPSNEDTALFSGSGVCGKRGWTAIGRSCPATGMQSPYNILRTINSTHAHPDRAKAPGWPHWHDSLHPV